jgi:ribonuclease R
MARSPYPQSDRDLVARIRRSAGGKAGYKQLIRELGLGGGRERRLLLEQLTRLVARGELRRLEDELWAVPPPREAETGQSYPQSTSRSTTNRAQSAEATFSQGGRERFATGRLDVHRDGFGFVRPENAGRSSGRGSQDDDIFIPPNALRGAMHGDLVLVDEDARGRDGRRSGRIARVLTRRYPTIVGIFHYGRRRTSRRRTDRDDETTAEISGNYVRPWDERMGGPIEIPPGAEVVTGEGSSPHRTLGEEARRARDSALDRNTSDRSIAGSEAKGEGQQEQGGPDERWPLEGLAVEVEITSYPQPGRPAIGRVIEVLGHPDAFGVDVEIIIRKHGIPHTFPAHVLAEADERAHLSPASLPGPEMELREDFRAFPVVTIDSESARDFDDAVLVRPLENGNTELQVHIADVSSYVLAGSALDTEARVRGTSVYFPDRAVPMLPHSLSSGMCSLLPNEDRLVLSCVMEIDTRGEVLGYRVAEGIIRSARRMTYTSVQSCINASPTAPTWNAHNAITPEPTAEDAAERERLGLEHPDLPAAFDRMLELALRLNRKRVRRGSIDFDLPEPVVEFDPDGNMKAIVRSERGWSHRLIEEFMLSANECVATWLTAQGIPSMYRIHEMPDPKRIVEFEETAAAFGQTLGIGALPVKRLSMKSDRREAQRRSARGRDSRQAPAHEIPERIPVTPQMYQKLVRKIAGKPEERILSYLMLRSLKQARYSEKNEGHFALASPCYTHFTSPIRRYPDLIVHRLVRAMLRGGADPRGGALLSTDPQPWKAELDRAQGRHSASVRPEPVVAPRLTKARRKAQPAAEEAVERVRPKRAGRIGWADESSANVFSEPRAGSGTEPLTLLPPVVSTERDRPLREPIPTQELADMATESSQAERRAADAERELIEWKKMKFMADKVGQDFPGIILSVTKFGFFVELDEMFIEGLVPLGSLPGDFYSFRDTDRSICGARTGHCFRTGDRVEVILDRIDRQQRRLQFALLPGTEPQPEPGAQSLRKGKSEAKKARAEAKRAEKMKPRKRRKS